MWDQLYTLFSWNMNGKLILTLCLDLYFVFIKNNELFSIEFLLFIWKLEIYIFMTVK